MNEENTMQQLTLQQTTEISGGAYLHRDYPRPIEYELSPGEAEVPPPNVNLPNDWTPPEVPKPLPLWLHIK
jgi:hypothetical protein